MNGLFTLFRRLTMGVYVIGVAEGRRRDAFTAASVAHVSYRPLLLSLAVNPQHASYELLLAGKAWTISVLSSDQIELARRFGTPSRSGTNKMDDVQWLTAGSGAPYLAQALAYFDCRLIGDFPAGDHRIVVGHVTQGSVLNAEATALIYAETDNLDQSAALYPASFDTA
jgi:flavin reductase (DIM6/NTAB) family NADH-FMN oxidoreductase RutF